MQDVMVVEGHKLAIRELYGERVVTFKDIDELHNRALGTTKRNFNRNKDKFVQGKDYYSLTRKEYADLFSDDAHLKGNPNLLIYLLTESGYLMLVKTLNDDKSWAIQRTLSNTYFAAKQTIQSNLATQTTAQFSMIRGMIDVLEKSQAESDKRQSILYAQQMQILKNQELIASQQDQLAKNTRVFAQAVINIGEMQQKMIDGVLEIPQQVSQIVEDKVATNPDAKFEVAPDIIQNKNELTSYAEIAIHLKLYMPSGKPHSRMVHAIAREAGLLVDSKRPYSDKYLTTYKHYIDEEGGYTFITKFTDEGVDCIISWYEQHKQNCYFEKFYKRYIKSKDKKPGDLMERGYRVNGRNWLVYKAE